MPSHKVLRSVVRSVADQFTSLTNYVGDDYVMGHLLNAVRETGQRTLTVNMLTGEAHPPELLTPEVARSVSWYSEGFPELVRRSGSAAEFVKSAEMRITFDTDVARARYVGDPLPESPYRCEVLLTDDRGKTFEASVSGWWYPEQPRRPTLWSRIRRVISPVSR